MKAEERKELETNALADRMGQVVRRVRQGPSRKTVLISLLILVGLIGWFIYARRGRLFREEQSKIWVDFEKAGLPNPEAFLQRYPKKPQADMARFQIHWINLWEGGIKLLGARPALALENMEVLREEYEALAKKNEKDPVLRPEALHALAVIAETRAILDQPGKSTNLDRALELYDELAKKHKESAYGKLAAERVELLSDEKSRKAVADFYLGLQIDFNVMEDIRQLEAERKRREEFKRVPPAK